MTARLAAFFALQQLAGSRAWAAYRTFRRMERWSAGELAAWQAARLRDLLAHATRAIPFYRETLGANATGASLQDFPILRKEDLASRFTALMQPDLRAEYEGRRARARYSWVEVTSGGTTGIPTTVLHDPAFRDAGRAARLYAMDLAGFPFGTPHYRIWGSMHDIQRTQASAAQRVMAALSGEVLLNAFRMEDDRVEAHLRAMHTGAPAHAIAWVDAVEQMARFARARGLPVRPLKTIMTTGGTLTDDTRALLRGTFGARIHNKYGSRDAGEIACECEAGSLHVFAPIATIEVVDEANRPLPPGERGRLLVTSLANRSFPIVRFDIGDTAALLDDPCPCGRSFPRLGRLEGRQVDFLTSVTGGFVSPVFIRHTIGVVHGPRLIRRFQLVQEAAGRYDLAIQPEAGAPREALEALREPLLRDLREALGRDAAIALRFVERIEEADSGKFRYTINRTLQSDTY